MKLHLAILALLPLSLAACDEAAMKDFQSSLGLKSRDAAEVAAQQPPANPQPPAISPLQQPIELSEGSKTLRATAQAATVDLTSFTASGTDRAWTVDVANNKAVYKRPNAKNTTVSLRRIVYAGGVEFVGVLGGSPFTIRVSAGECRTADGGKMPLSAVLRTGSTHMPGCAAPAAPAAPQKAVKTAART